MKAVEFNKDHVVNDNIRKVADLYEDYVETPVSMVEKVIVWTTGIFLAVAIILVLVWLA